LRPPEGTGLTSWRFSSRKVPTGAERKWSRATISDPRVRALADRIIEAQVIEIEEMRLLLSDIQNVGEQGNQPLPPRPAELSAEMSDKARMILD
jgi:hypothetical protein